ncbi:MAPEG family protein [Aestuariivirga sp.]|uniref:MAPEG family protein n=1 Tax=Aestuariivirga sp. TaxID=2650926 RepID=UPI00391A2252
MDPAKWLLLAAFLHVGWVTVLGVRLGRARFRAARAGRVKVKDIALDSSRWPDDVRKLSNNFDNQFQVPVLFYAILPLLLVTGLADTISVVLAWVFVASRIVHSLVHTGGNVVTRRFQVFLFGFVAIGLMWAWFGLRYYVIG